MINLNIHSEGIEKDSTATSEVSQFETCRVVGRRPGMY